MLALLDPDAAATAVGGGQVRSQIDHAVEIPQGLVIVALLQVQAAAVEVSRSEFRLQAQRLAQVRQGGVVLLPPRSQPSAFHVGPGNFGRDPQRGGEILQRFLVLVFVRPGQGAIQVGEDQLRLQLQGPAVFADRPFVVAPGAADVASIGVRQRPVRLHFDRRLEVLGGFVEFPLFQPHGPLQIPGHGILGIQVQGGLAIAERSVGLPQLLLGKGPGDVDIRRHSVVLNCRRTVLDRPGGVAQSLPGDPAQGMGFARFRLAGQHEVTVGGSTGEIACAQAKLRAIQPITRRAPVGFRAPRRNRPASTGSSRRSVRRKPCAGPMPARREPRRDADPIAKPASAHRPPRGNPPGATRTRPRWTCSDGFRRSRSMAALKSAKAWSQAPNCR